jgi:membrane protein
VEVAKQGFEAYTDLLGARDNLARIYGQVALLPVLLLWIYVFWLVVLFGVEVAFLVHNHGSLLDAQRRLATDPDAARRQPDGFFALAVLGLIIEHHERGRGPLSAAALSELSGADPRHLQVVLDVLEEGALIVETADKGFLPARPAAQISASEVLRLWRDKAAPAVFGPARGSLQMALAAVDHALMGNLSSHGRQGGGRA